MASNSQYDAIERKNIANILAKLKSGKTLTASDHKALDNHKRKDLGLRPKKTESELAKEFNVNRRGSIVRWKKLKAPFEGTDAEMYQWLVDNNIRGANEWKKSYRINNPDIFPNKVSNKTENEHEIETENKTAEQLRDDYLADLHLAKANEDEAREKVALNAYLKIDKQIREAEAHAKKLGIDRGEVLARSEVERILKAVFHAGNACCDKFSKQIAQKISNKNPAEVYEILAPTLTCLTLFEAMKRVTKTPGDINVPEWVIECSKTEEKHYIDYE